MAMSRQPAPPVNQYTGSYTEDAGGDGLRMNAYNHDDVDVAFDPFSTNRRFPSTDDLAVLGTLIFAGPTRESIDVMVLDCLLPPVGGTVRVDLRHHVSLSLGPAVDMTNWVPETHLEKALCPSSLAKTLGLQRRDYWEELNPILEKWRSVNNTRCPECTRQIRVNMARHLRLMHTTYVCFCRCPVLSCSLWFTSELNAKDHIESIHHFREGHGTSFYECLRKYGLEWFGSRDFFDGRRQASQTLWMDLALARRSGQENTYIITKEPGVRFSTSLLPGRRRPVTTPFRRITWSLIAQMRAAVADCDDISSEGSLMLLSPPRDIPDATLPAGSEMDISRRDAVSPVVMTRWITPANRPLQHLEAGQLGASTPQHVASRPSVPDLCIASANLLSLIDPLPLDRLSRHTVATICLWPATDRHHILAVANRDLRVARQNLAELQLYVDDHAAHIANCASADDDEIPLMSAETFPRLEG